ncbi:MAG: cob(I)yrinic acid a,c-diamide adenosyltransferase [Fibrobacteres bacterium]|nr:cob(I)yrinic acid a,c-diamide adenosyltransferase [Fibrobacterota bacterium]
MPPITRIYTRGGDQGNTRLGGGQKVSKTALRLECYGTVDELNSQLGLVRALGACQDLLEPLERIQNELFDLGSDLCFLEEDKGKWSIPQIREDRVEALEREIDGFMRETPPLENFILPGGTTAAATLHVARTVCRRAERLCVRLQDEERTNPLVVRYLNRLSDWLFAASRLENLRCGVAEPLWRPGG